MKRTLTTLTIAAFEAAGQSDDELRRENAELHHENERLTIQISVVHRALVIAHDRGDTYRARALALRRQAERWRKKIKYFNPDDPDDYRDGTGWIDWDRFWKENPSATFERDLSTWQRLNSGIVPNHDQETIAEEL